MNQLIKKIALGETDLIKAIRTILPGYFSNESSAEIRSDADYVYLYSGLLVYVSFCTSKHLNVFREIMQNDLKDSDQEFILEFLVSMEKHELKNISLQIIKEQIEIMEQNHRKVLTSAVNDNIKTTPVKSSRTSPKDCGSPLMLFFKVLDQLFLLMTLAK